MRLNFRIGNAFVRRARRTAVRTKQIICV